MNQYTQEYFKDLEDAVNGEVIRNLRLLRKIERFRKPGKLLDVGIGTGLFLKLAKSHQWRLIGIDISHYAVEKVKKELKINIIKQELEDAHFKTNSFDVVNMRHTIEHVKNPLRVLGEAYRILKPNGIICIATPNSQGIHTKIYGRAWPHWDFKHHLSFFSKDSLRNLVENCGFEILEISTEELTIYNSIRAIISKIGIPLNFAKTSSLSFLFDRFLAQLGFGEGLVLLAKKPSKIW